MAFRRGALSDDSPYCRTIRSARKADGIYQRKAPWQMRHCQVRSAGCCAASNGDGLSVEQLAKIVKNISTLQQKCTETGPGVFEFEHIFVGRKTTYEKYLAAAIRNTPVAVGFEELKAKCFNLLELGTVGFHRRKSGLFAGNSGQVDRPAQNPWCGGPFFAVHLPGGVRQCVLPPHRRQESFVGVRQFGRAP